jgi:HEAT repeat protein
LWAGALRPSKLLLREGNRDGGDAVRGEAAALACRVLGRARNDDDFEQIYLLRQLGDKTGPYPHMVAMAHLRRPENVKNVVKVLADADPFLATSALLAAGRPEHIALLLPHVQAKDARLRLGVLLALRRCGEQGVESVPAFLKDPDPAVRRAAIQWVAEAKLTQYAKLLDTAATKAPVSREVFEAWLAAQELLANPGGSKDANKELSGDVFVLKAFKNPKSPPELRTLALQMLRPDHPGLKLSDLSPLLTADKRLRNEAVRALAWRTESEAQKLLRQLAGDTKEDGSVRLDAIQGLAHSAATNAETRNLLLDLLKGWHSSPTCCGRSAAP